MPCSGAHYRQGQIRECPPSRKHLQNEELSMQYMMYRSKEKKTIISWKIKMKHKNQQYFSFSSKTKYQSRSRLLIKVKENKTRIKITEFYKWCSSNTGDIKSVIYSFRRFFIFGLFIFFLTSVTALSAIFQAKRVERIRMKATDYFLKIFRSRYI